MQNNFFALLSIGAVLFFASSCVPANKCSEEWRLRSLEENFLAFQETQARQQEDMQRLAGEINELKQIRSSAAATAPNYSTYSRTSTAEVYPPSAPVNQTQQPAPPQTQRPPAPPPAQAVSAQPAYTQKASGKTPAAQAQPANSSDKSTYDQALKTLRAGHNAQARTLFQNFMEKFPNSPLMPNALYWLGETYYHDGNFPQAIISFKEGSARYPQSNKAAACLLKAAYAYEKLGDKENARMNLQALLSGYPKSELIKQAREGLTRLGQ